MRRGALLVIFSLLASAALIVTFLALGGSSYAPADVRDPCRQRPWGQAEGLQENVERFTLAALDGAACELHTSRETLVVALASKEGRERFADDPRLEAAVRAGFERAIDDAERAGELDPLLADGLRELAKRAPADEVIALIEDSGPVFEGIAGLLEHGRGLLPDELQGILP